MLSPFTRYVGILMNYVTHFIYLHSCVAISLGLATYQSFADNSYEVLRFSTIFILVRHRRSARLI